MSFRVKALFSGAILLSFALSTAVAQSTLLRVLNFECIQCRPADALVALSRQTGVNIQFADPFFSKCGPVTVSAHEETFQTILEKIAACSGKPYKVMAENWIVFYSPEKQQRTFSGYVKDADSGEVLLGVSIGSLTEKGRGTVTNEFGFFSLRLEEGAHRIALARVGYHAVVRELDFHSDLMMTLKMRSNNTLPEVLIRPSAQRDSGQQSEQFSPTLLGVQDLKYMPSPGGEPDLMRQVALESGVQTGVDGLGGLHVRGGNADQNLILLDDVPVYNPSHALGLFSIFNTNTVSQARLWKGDFPARYSGRASSVLDVRTRDGNMKEYHAHATMGLFASSATVEGPIVRERSSFLIGGRITYFDPWVQFFSRRGNLLTFSSGDGAAYRFFDGNAKLNYVLSNNNRIYLSLYQGGDRFRNIFKQEYVSEEGIVTDTYNLNTEWGNTIAALRWNHILRPNLFSNTTLRFSRFIYQSRLGLDSRFLSASGKESVLANYSQIYQTLIRDGSVKTDFTFYPYSRLTLRGGAAFTRHAFQPGALAINLLQPGQSPGSVDSIANLLLNNESLVADEVEGYLDADWRLAPHWRAELGLNGSIFQGKNLRYQNILPRIRVQGTSKRGWSIWAGYHRTAQYLHQIGSFNISLPFELWVPSTRKVQPEQVGQWTSGIGWQRNGWRWQIEGYDKRLDRVLTFISSNDALYNGGAEDASGWEDRIAEGTGRSRGLEFLFGKNRGSTTWSVAYTISKTSRQFPELNSGKVFPFRFDRRNDIKIVVRQRITRWLEADAIWAFATGNPITLAGAKFQYQSANGEIKRDVYVYTSINGYRLPNYHRLDASLTVQFGHKKVRHLLQLSAYNAYNHANPFYRYVDTSGTRKTNAIEYTLLPVLPGLRYEVKF